MNKQRHPSCCDLEVTGDAIEVLNTGTDKWPSICRVGDFCAAASRKLDAFGRVFVDELLVNGRKHGSCEVQNRPVLDVAIASGILAHELHEVFALGGADPWNSLLGKSCGEKI